MRQRSNLRFPGRVLLFGNTLLALLIPKPPRGDEGTAANAPATINAGVYLDVGYLRSDNQPTFQTWRSKATTTR